jgi:hypothetical protein
MGFGAIITAGDDLKVLDDAAMQRIVEARIEHELSKTARFALRFEDDICEEEPAVAGHPQLQAGIKVGIFVESDGALDCLIYGPITQVRSAATTGGTGNWHEVHGEDRRVEMDRVEIQGAYEGHASDTARQILEGYGFSPDVQDTERVYNSDDNKLTQRGSDLKFLETIAQKNNYEFWINYEVGPTNPLTGVFSLDEAANLQPSPSRGSPSPVPVPPVLVPTVDREIRVSPPPTDCPNVTRFEVTVDYERPHAAKGFAMDLSAGEQTATDSEPAADPLDPERNDLASVSSIERSVLASTSGDPIEQRLSQEAAVTEAAWFVEVKCSATLDQFGAILLPHEIVGVANAGPQLEGPYQVTKALHVINAMEHIMDFTIRANGLKGGS